MTTKRLSRRRFATVIGTGLAVGLAGCSDDGETVDVEGEGTGDPPAGADGGAGEEPGGADEGADGGDAGDDLGGGAEGDDGAGV